jgi:predicted nucleic acid-binding protein
MRSTTSTSAICVDANLVIRRVAEPDNGPVQELWGRWAARRQRLVAPTLLRYEVTNALYRSQRAGLLSPEARRDLLAAALALPIEVQGDAALHQEAADLAERFALLAAYDAHYLALAQRLGTEFWTTDGRLGRAVRPTLSWVRLVGE